MDTGPVAQRGEPPLRVHQREALAAVAARFASGARRAWVVLPPGAGKTRLGLEVARHLGHRTVVLGPNTAIVAQWLEAAGADAGADRDLSAPLTALTYQALAVFDDADDDPADHDLADSEAGRRTPLLDALHANGRDLVDRLVAAGPLTLVLDECHHLLAVWGRLLAELLALLPEASVIGLTATPPTRLSPTEAALVADLFGPITYETSIPAVVREGHLAPFAELAWVTEPTPREYDWLRAEGLRFTELTTLLADPERGSVPLLSWLARRTGSTGNGVGAGLPWHRLAKAEPELTDAVLRLVHRGLLDLPDGARLEERHRVAPTAPDWVCLVDDWVSGHLRASPDPDDVRLLETVRAALPTVGYRLTGRGVRPGRSTTDLVLARSEAKTHAAAEIVAAEHRTLGERLRMLVLCDHEQAAAVRELSLDGVLPAEAGSARRVLVELLRTTPGLDPVLVTGRTVAGAEETLLRLRAHCGRSDLVIEPGEGGMALLTGRWQSREWVPAVTRFFEAGGCRVLVGTRGLLGEGWDARCVSGLIDLTTATTTTAVVQTRGRSLRVDPTWPDKVAVNWTVVCVHPEHPRGTTDWDRFVAKHDGFYGTDHEGDVVAGVGHVDPLLSPYAPPPAPEYDAVNARMLARAEDRDTIREGWRVGAPYADMLVHTVRLRLPARGPAQPGPTGAPPTPPEVRVGKDRLEVGSTYADAWRPGAAVTAGLVAGLAAVATLSVLPWLAVAGGLLVLLSVLGQARVVAGRGQEILGVAGTGPSVDAIGAAVADALHDAGRVTRGAEAVRVELDDEGQYRCRLDGVPARESQVFAMALDEVVSPMAHPRYVVPRWVLPETPPGLVDAWAAAVGRLRDPAAEVWHSVPTELGRNARDAAVFARAWSRWVGGGDAVYTGSAQGEGILVTHRGLDPFAATTVLRAHWA